MKRYNNYKDSGIEWIAEIPTAWDVKPLKFIADITLGKMLTPEDKGDYILKPYLRSQNIQINDVDIADVKNMWFSQGELSKYRLRHGDILVNEGGDIGRTCRWNGELEECYIQNSVNRVRMINGSSKFYLYHFYLHHQTGHFDSIVNRVSIPHLTKEKLTNILFVVPPLEEQTQIAHYLDQKTAQIEKLITDKEKLIELLNEERTAIINHAVTKGLSPDVPMRDSGVEWLGEIPKHWKITRLKHVTAIRYGLGQPPKQKEGGLPIIRATNVERGRISTKDLIYVDPDDIPWHRDPVLKEDDIIVVRSGAYTGDSAIITKEYDGSITGYDMVIRPLSANPRFIAFSLLSTYLLDNQLFLERLRAAQPHLNAEELGNTFFIEPDIEEQAELVTYIQNEHKRVDDLLLKTKQEIQLLKEYKTALISEVVTGKVDVRDEVIVA